jgi:tetratricopeptide (TPR) repeat protein
LALAGSEPLLRSRVEELLGAYDRNATDRFLERPPQGEGFDVLALCARDDPLAPDSTPRSAGPFIVERLLAEGDFTSVYVARQSEPVRRAAAVKVLHSAVRSRRTLSRFALERQAVAAMRHPHIAQFYDAGTTDTGLAYFAMELVDGPSITEFCRRRALTVPDRLALFLQVCSAITHAHQRGMIHRDLKPSNILVGAGDAQAAVKVIDFGVAKALGPAGRGSPATLTGQVVGTLAYMSPEQLRGQTDLIDTRTDVYSLGLVLFEVLAERPAFSAPGAGPSPSPLRLAEAPPPRLADARRDLRGDLDTIVAKATAATPDERYAFVADLARDIERHLAGLPIVARRSGRLYAAAKFVRRHRVGTVAAALAVGVTSVMGLAAWQARTERLDLAMQLAGAWLDETLRMQRTIGERSRRAPIVERLVEHVDRLASVAPNDPRVLAMRAAALAERGYLAMDSRRPAEALVAFSEALRIRRELADAAPRDIDRQKELSMALARTGDAAGAAGDAATQRARYRDALRTDEALVHGAPLDRGALSDLGWSYERLAALMPPDQPDRLTLFRKQAATFERLAAIAPTCEAQRGQSAAYLNIGQSLERAGAPFGDAARRAVAFGRTAVAADPADRLALHTLILAELLDARAAVASSPAAAAGRAKEAAAHAEELFTKDSGDRDSREVLAVALTRAASLAVRAGQTDDASNLAARAIPHLRELSAHASGSGWDAELASAIGLLARLKPLPEDR